MFAYEEKTKNYKNGVYIFVFIFICLYIFCHVLYFRSRRPPCNDPRWIVSTAIHKLICLCGGSTVVCLLFPRVYLQAASVNARTWLLASVSMNRGVIIKISLPACPNRKSNYSISPQVEFACDNLSLRLMQFVYYFSLVSTLFRFNRCRVVVANRLFTKRTYKWPWINYYSWLVFSWIAC